MKMPDKNGGKTSLLSDIGITCWCVCLLHRNLDSYIALL